MDIEPFLKQEVQVEIADRAHQDERLGTLEAAGDYGIRVLVKGQRDRQIFIPWSAVRTISRLKE